MIAIDTNLLVYAHREDSVWHKKADEVLAKLSEGGIPWAIPWPCLYEFLAITTHPKIYKPPTPLNDAFMQIECWLEAPTLHLLYESEDTWTLLKSVIQAGKVVGPTIHEGRIVSLCIQHGVTTLWSADRDFSRFAGLKVENPLL